MIKYITIAGTNGAGKSDWDSLNSPFVEFLHTQNCEPLVTNPLQRYMWSTMLDGVDSSNYTWDASGRALSDYIVPPLYGKSLLTPEDTYVIAHSHGGNVVAYACGKYGLKINGLITVGTPIRNDLWDMYEMAAPNIQRHIHLYGGWRDYWQVLGALWDGRFGLHRKHPFARNERTPGGHGSILRDQKLFQLWMDKGWLQYWMGNIIGANSPTGETETPQPAPSSVQL